MGLAALAAPAAAGAHSAALGLPGAAAWGLGLQCSTGVCALSCQWGLQHGGGLAHWARLQKENAIAEKEANDDAYHRRS